MGQFIFGLIAGVVVGLVMEWVIDWSGLLPRKPADQRERMQSKQSGAVTNRSRNQEASRADIETTHETSDASGE